MATAPSSTKEEEKQCHGDGGGGWVVQAIAMLVATAVTAQAAYRARGAPWDLAFVLFSYAALALLFLCLSMYERLPTLEQEDDGEHDGATAGKRRRLKLAVWALSTALSVAFAWRVAAVMPSPALKAVIWGMTSTVAFAGFFVLFVYRPAAVSSYSELVDTSCNKDEEKSSPKLEQIV